MKKMRILLLFLSLFDELSAELVNEFSDVDGSC